MRFDSPAAARTAFAILVVACAIGLAARVNYGLPTGERIDSVLGGQAVSAERREAIDTQRADFFAAVEEAVAADATALLRGDAGQRAGDAAYDRYGKPPDQPEIGEDIKIALLRLQIVRSAYLDESATLSALARMNPRTFDFDPNFYNYGGAYLYAVAAAGFLGAQAGVVRLETSIAAYLDDPSGIAQLYRIARGLGAIAFLAILALLYDLGRRAAGNWTGVAAATVFAVSPPAWIHGTEAKPHLYAAAWGLLVLYCLYRHRTERRRSLLAVASVAAGLAMGSALGEAWLVASLPILLIEPNDLRRSTVRVLAVWSGAATVFAATNPYYFLRLPEFLYTLNLQGSSYGRTSPRFESMAMVLHQAFLSVGVPVFLAVLIGLFAAWNREPARLRLALVTILLVVIGGSVVRDLRFVLVAVPLFAFFAADGIRVVVARLNPAHQAVAAAALLAVGIAPGLAALANAARLHALSTDRVAAFRTFLAAMPPASTQSVGIVGYPPPVPFTPPLFRYAMLDVRQEVLGHLEGGDDRRTPNWVFVYERGEDAVWLREPRYQLVFDAVQPVPTPSWLPAVVQVPATNLSLFTRVYRRTG